MAVAGGDRELATSLETQQHASSNLQGSRVGSQLSG